MGYVPTPGPLPGEQWKPSNSDIGHSFLASECGNCARDKAMREGCDLDECDDNEKCEIIGASFRGEAVEWRRLPTGEVKCIAFVPAGEPIPPQRDDRTLDMFELPNAIGEGPGGGRGRETPGYPIGGLLPCPCCGFPADVRYSAKASLGLPGWTADCTVCVEAAQYTRFTRDRAVESWNNYASNQTPNVEVRGASRLAGEASSREAATSTDGLGSE